MFNLAHLKNPIDELESISEKYEIDILSENFSFFLDNFMPTFRSKFCYPKRKDLTKIGSKASNEDQECIYLCGHSLGLQPTETKKHIEKIINNWAKLGVAGHFDGEEPWTTMEYKIKPLMADLIGASCDEIALLNSLTVNLNLLLISFYQPKNRKTKILLEDKAFPSDYYAIESQIRLNNLDPQDHMICLKPREGEHTLRNEDILDTIEKHGDEIALVLFSGIQYFTGQLFKIKEITQAAHKKGCFVGFDLAHAVGNVQLKLHEWNIDFGVWCTYKYLNSGPGGIGGMFLHERNFNINCKKLDGWWGHDLQSRFLMNNKMDYCFGVSKYCMSTAPNILLACLEASLKVFKEAGFEKLVRKSIYLTTYMEYLLEKKINNSKSVFEQITPKIPDERGSHISIKFSMNAQVIFEELQKNGIICDYRSPDVLRFSAVPLYNTFNEVFKFIDILKKCIDTAKI